MDYPLKDKLLYAEKLSDDVYARNAKRTLYAG